MRMPVPSVFWTQRRSAGVTTTMRVHRMRALIGVVALSVAAAALTRAHTRQPDLAHPDIFLFRAALDEDDDTAAAALDEIAAHWRDGYTGIVLDIVRFLVPPGPDLTADERRSARVWQRLMDFLELRTNQRFAGSTVQVQQWMWEQPYDPHPDYAFFKGAWYAQIDPEFERFFPAGARSTIRLDEIDWGGVGVNGIPPLVYAPHVPAPEASYLDDEHIVFGIAAGGATRAYPQRILARHEMALDRLGGTELTIVYCTMCGTVIPYDSVVDGRHIVFGTSGLLFRSNKLMFDEETRSLWNTFEGVPVVGSLVGSGIRLRHRSVVTTTWGEWRRMHPGTTVLSLDTGHQLDYSEGSAYRDYFSHDDLWFSVPELDDRLGNKDAVLVMLLEDADGTRRPLAVAVEFLRARAVHMQRHAGRHLAIVTSGDGANRVYDAGSATFERVVGDDALMVMDARGERWRVTEDALVHTADATRRAPRVAAQRAFWFGWYAQFPDTRLIK